MLAVIDTNVLISRYLSPHGSPNQVFDSLRRNVFDLLVSPDIVTEYAGVLRRDKFRALHGLTEADIRNAVAYLLRRALVVVPPEKLRVIPDDLKDDKFIECAVAGGADVIVSGDKHLLALGSFEGIRIATPAAFVTLLESEKPREAAGCPSS